MSSEITPPLPNAGADSTAVRPRSFKPFVFSAVIIGILIAVGSLLPITGNVIDDRIESTYNVEVINHNANRMGSSIDIRDADGVYKKCEIPTHQEISDRVPLVCEPQPTNSSQE